MAKDIHSLQQHYFHSFWEHVCHSRNKSLPLSTMIDNCTGEENIALMWQRHFATLLNCVNDNSTKESVLTT